MNRFNKRSAVLLSCATLLSACGGSDSDKSTTATTAGGAETKPADTATNQATTTTATANKAALSCADIPASLVNSVLGTTVEGPKSVPRQSGGLRCDFVGKAQSVLITLDNESTVARFKTNKTNAEFLGGKSTPVSGLGDEAFASGLKVPGEPTVNELHAKEGNRAVSVVTSSGTLEQLTALLKQLLAK